jgi:Flp pilus assembly protein TadG
VGEAPVLYNKSRFRIQQSVLQNFYSENGISINNYADSTHKGKKQEIGNISWQNQQNNIKSGSILISSVTQSN